MKKMGQCGWYWYRCTLTKNHKGRQSQARNGCSCIKNADAVKEKERGEKPSLHRQRTFSASDISIPPPASRATLSRKTESTKRMWLSCVCVGRGGRA